MLAFYLAFGGQVFHHGCDVGDFYVGWELKDAGREVFCFHVFKFYGLFGAFVIGYFYFGWHAVVFAQPHFLFYAFGFFDFDDFALDAVIGDGFDDFGFGRVEALVVFVWRGLHFSGVEGHFGGHFLFGHVIVHGVGVAVDDRDDFLVGYGDLGFDFFAHQPEFAVHLQVFAGEDVVIGEAAGEVFAFSEEVGDGFLFGGGGGFGTVGFAAAAGEAEAQGGDGDDGEQEFFHVFSSGLFRCCPVVYIIIHIFARQYYIYVAWGGFVLYLWQECRAKEVKQDMAANMCTVALFFQFFESEASV